MADTQYTNTLPLDSMLMEYRLIAVLGVGGFGITYQGRDTLLEKDVAIKEYFPGADVARLAGGSVTLTNTQRNEEYSAGLDSFLQEARTLAGFSHPNIIRVNRYFKANGTGYMVMDYEEGETLNTYFQKNPLPPESKLKSLLGMLLDGLGKVHKTGFLHRDIKPDNIFMRADDTPVLIDFGSARQAMGGARRTLTALVTPGYAPFEQYTTQSEQGPWSDIYALGGILFFAVTGDNPPDALTRMKQDRAPELLERATKKYSESFLEAIRWALEIDEKKRPQNVSEWRTRIIGDVVASSPVPPSPAPDLDLSASYGTSPGPATDSQPLPPLSKTESTTLGSSTVKIPGSGPDTQDISSFLDRRDEAERVLKAKFQRVLTVMFTDLKGSTAIAESSGDIAVRSMLKRYHDLCLIAVKRHDGTLVKTIGDGSLSHFEDAAAACRAAAEIQRGMEEINLSKVYKTILLARIGMHTGECILEKNDVFGDVVNTASRFESSAHPGEIFISEDTYNAIVDKTEFYARFDRDVALKGKSMPFKGYAVFWDPKEIERDLGKSKVTTQAKPPTPAWKLALLIIIPTLVTLAMAIWITGGEKFSGETKRSIDHEIPTTPQKK
jgi:serine/threonine protein kinase